MTDLASQRTVTITYTGQLDPTATDEQLKNNTTLFTLMELLNSDRVRDFTVTVSGIQRDVPLVAGDAAFTDTAERAIVNTLSLMMSDEPHEHDADGNCIK